MVKWRIDSATITVTSHGLSNYQQLDYLLNGLGYRGERLAIRRAFPWYDVIISVEIIIVLFGNNIKVIKFV